MSVAGSGFTAAALAPVAASCTPAGFAVPTTALLSEATDAATVSPAALVVVVAAATVAFPVAVAAATEEPPADGDWTLPVPTDVDWPLPVPVDGDCPLTVPLDCTVAAAEVVVLAARVPAPLAKKISP